MVSRSVSRSGLKNHGSALPERQYHHCRIRLLSYQTDRGWRARAVVRTDTASGIIANTIEDELQFYASKHDADLSAYQLARVWVDQRPSRELGQAQLIRSLRSQ